MQTAQNISDVNVLFPKWQTTHPGGEYAAFLTWISTPSAERTVFLAENTKTEVLYRYGTNVAFNKVL